MRPISLLSNYPGAGYGAILPIVIVKHLCYSVQAALAIFYYGKVEYGTNGFTC